MGNYWLLVVCRAIREAWDLLAGQPFTSLFWYAVVLAMASAIQYAWLGKKVMTDEVRILVTVVSAALIVGLFIFIVKLFAIPPVLHDEKTQEVEDLKIVLEREKLKNRPALKGHIETTVTGISDVNSTDVLILMTIKNTGTPSIVEGYKLAIVSKTLNQSVGPTTIPEHLTLTHIKSEKPVRVVHQKDALYEKTITPIPMGGLARGWLRFILRGISRDQITIGTKITVSFKDVLDTTYEAHQILEGPGSDPPLYYPGGGGLQ